jgi:2-oxoglutarate ferredoxin oxidoreductase subunit beta
LALGDDGFSLGVLYRGDRAPVAPPLQPQISIADIEREFALSG